MRIAQIAPPWYPVPPTTYGGTENVLYHLVEQLVTQGHKVTLFAPGDARTSAEQIAFFSPSLIAAGVPWPSHLKAYYHHYKAIEYLKNHADDFDIVHTHLSSAADMYLFPLTVFLPLPHVMTLHSRFPFDRLTDRIPSWFGDADDFYMEWASIVPMVAVSEAAKAEVSYHLNFMGIVHNGLSPELFHLVTRELGDFFIWIGLIVPEKAPHLAIQAAKKAGVPIVLAGFIDEHRADSGDYFEQQFKPMIDNQQVQYIGPVNAAQKIALMSQARGFLNPLDWEEPFGMTIIEAMAAGCPVIAFHRGAMPELIAHGTSGFLVGDIDEMASFIPRISELDRNALRAYAEQRFSANVMTGKYVTIYDKVIATWRSETRK